MSDNSISCQHLLDRLTHIMTKTRLMKKFIKFKNLEEKICFCLSNENIEYDQNTFINIKKEISEVLQVFYSLSPKHMKSERIAEQFKIKGSKAFLKRRDDEAFQLYTDGLRHAPDGSNLLPLLYANRSATHIQRNKYKECLEDIERAEKAGYPLDAQYKLHKRKIEALLKLGRKKEAQETLKQAKASIVASTKGSLGNQPKTDQFSTSLKELEEQILGLKLEATTIPPGRKAASPLPPLFKEDREREMSGALKIRVNPSNGRHICARALIPKGSALFRERPFAAILLPEYFLTHCQACFSPLVNPVPCKGCSDVFWCAERCRSEGETFHRFECTNLHIISSVGIAHLALRIVLTAGWPICEAVRSESKSSPRLKEDPSELFYSKDGKSRYKAVFSLLNHLEKAAIDDQFQYSLAALILAKVTAERTAFLPPAAAEEEEDASSSSSSCSPSSPVVCLSALLVHHISQLVSNAHAITQIEGKNEGGETSPISQISQRRVASAIYPLASLMNHSCKPSIINSFQGDVLLIHSVEEIPKGSQLYNCYGPHACRQERKERQVALDRQYFFHCRCSACTDDSLLIKEASWSGLLCPDCGGIGVTEEASTRAAEEDEDEEVVLTCLECHVTKKMPAPLIRKCERVNTLYEDGQESFKNGRYVEAENYFLKALLDGEKVFVRNNEFLNTIRDNLAKSYAVQGKLDESLQQLTLCLKTVEARFGENSVEMAHELLKYLDVIRMAKCSNSIVIKESELTRNRIKRIFATHYGAMWENYLQLQGI